MKAQHQTIFLTFLICLVRLSEACQIAGKQIGSCQFKPLSAASFCGSSIGQYVCTPSFNQTWSQYNANYKDAQIKFKFLTYVQTQLISDYQSTTPSLVLANNPDCYDSYKNFICQWNFPRCDPLTDSTIQPCISLCSSYYSHCKGTADACQIIWSSRDSGLDESC